MAIAERTPPLPDEANPDAHIASDERFVAGSMATTDDHSPDQSGASDAVLIASALRDPDQFDDLFLRYHPQIWRYCGRRLGDLEEAKDVASITMQKVWSHLRSFEDRGDSFRTWVFTVAHNEIESHRRKQSYRRSFSLSELFGHADPAPSPEQIAEFGDEWARAQRQLARFPGDHRRVLELRLAGLSGKEIADILGMSHANVRQIESRAFNRMRKLRNEEERHAI